MAPSQAHGRRVEKEVVRDGTRCAKLSREALPCALAVTLHDGGRRPRAPGVPARDLLIHAARPGFTTTRTYLPTRDVDGSPVVYVDKPTGRSFNYKQLLEEAKDRSAATAEEAEAAGMGRAITPPVSPSSSGDGNEPGTELQEPEGESQMDAPRRAFPNNIIPRQRGDFAFNRVD